MPMRAAAFALAVPSRLLSCARRAGGLGWHATQRRRLCCARAAMVAAADSRGQARAQVLVYDLRGAPVPYQQAWELQHALADARRRDKEVADALVLLEHEPVYTLGTASSLEHVLFSAEELRRGQTHGGGGAPLLVRTERGGEVTYHGPGQLVAYPILNLGRHRKDLHWYLRSLEEVVVRMLRDGYGIEAGRKEGLTGVWVGGEKVCALGLKVSRWITMHGLAVNVNVDLGAFERIVPCGVHGKAVTSLAKLRGDVCMDEAKRVLVQSFCDVFGPYDVVAADSAEEFLNVENATCNSGGD